MAAALLLITLFLSACGSAETLTAPPLPDATASPETVGPSVAQPEVNANANSTVVTDKPGSPLINNNPTDDNHPSTPVVQGVAVSVARIQVKIATGDRSHAGTDSRVRFLFCQDSTSMNTENCARVTLETATSDAVLERGQNVQTFTLSDSQDLKVITNTSYFNYFKIENLNQAQGGWNSKNPDWFVSGVKISIIEKGSTTLKPIYSNPCLSTWITFGSSLTLGKNDVAGCILTKTADVKDGGTDDLIQVILSQGQSTHPLNYAYKYNDFERGDVTTYGILQSDHYNLPTGFSLQLEGSDGVALDYAKAVFFNPGSKAFLEGKGNCTYGAVNQFFWLDDNSRGFRTRFPFDADRDVSLTKQTSSRSNTTVNKYCDEMRNFGTTAASRISNRY